MELQEWRAIGASVSGTSHLRRDTPCQDAHRLEIVGDEDPVVVLIASDGAGSASRSEEGSALACQEMRDNIRLYLEEGGRVEDVTRERALSWLENAATAVQQAAEREGMPVREFACTLLAAIVAEHHAVFVQVGDGAIVFWGRG